LAHTRVR